MTEQRPKYFGTDGVRGQFGQPPLDEPTVRRLARGLAASLRQRTSVPRLVMGGDTRYSTETLGLWLDAELRGGGCQVVWLGTVPTPAVAHRTAALGADCGIAVSASHNPYPDNGIKLIDAEGFKWSPAAELALEQRWLAETEKPPQGEEDLSVSDEEVAAYLEHLSASVEGDRPLAGLRVALDTGNGAASAFARRLFEDLGAEVHGFHHQPTGRNINLDCGSTHPEVLAKEVVELEADVGFSFDGDADRVILIDEKGEVRDGDAVLYLWAKDLGQRGQLPGSGIVATSMSNLGLEVALRRQGIDVVRCDVGDREVVSTLRNDGLVLGGEQSGHVVHMGLSTTGDGLLTALQMAALRCRDGRLLSEALADFQRFPQLLHNLRVEQKIPFDQLPKVMALHDDVVARLGAEGRLVLRYSGTEPLARIMLEGPDRAVIEGMAEELAEVIAAELA